MTRRPAAPFDLLGIWLCATTFTGCDNDPTGSKTYQVTYRVTATPGIALDSIKYDGGHGTFVKVVAPTAPWSVTLSVAAPGSVDVMLWGVGTNGGMAKLVATYAVPGQAPAGDSSSVSTATAAPFLLDITPRTLP